MWAKFEEQRVQRGYRLAQRSIRKFMPKVPTYHDKRDDVAKRQEERAAVRVWTCCARVVQLAPSVALRTHALPRYRSRFM